MSTQWRIALVLDPATGDWKRPDCECRYHFWDGEPDTFEEDFKKFLFPLPVGQTLLMGKVAPHIHLCPKHQDLDMMIDTDLPMKPKRTRILKVPVVHLGKHKP